MSNVLGNKLKISLFGESHGKAIGCVISGFPHGFKIDEEALYSVMKRRAPGGKLSTKRKESDEFEILSGILDGITTGAPICIIIKNEDVRSRDYNDNIMRPSHSDYPAHMRFEGFNDKRGGGVFSGRLTAPVTAAGALALQYLLKEHGISVRSELTVLGGTENPSDTEIENIVMQLRTDGDSYGGKIRVLATGLKPGIGGIFFGSLESKISSAMFSIPGLKAIEFGAGTEFAYMYGSEANDQFGEGGLMSNKTGGISGGLSNGEKIDFTLTFRPTPSISKEQMAYDISTDKEVAYKITGRHDPAFVLRAGVVAECYLGLVLLDELL